MSVDCAPPKRALLALDIEARGASVIHHGILAIGYCLGRADTFEIIECGRICFRPMRVNDCLQTYEPRSVAEFWCNHQDIAITLEKEALHASDAVCKFYALLQKFSREYDVSIITDFPSFDVAQIDFYLATYWFPALHFKPLSDVELRKFKDRSNTIPVDLHYHPVYDTDSYARGAMGYDYSKPWVNDKDVAEKFGFDITTKTTHYPDDDACHIYEVHVKTVLAQKRT
jgi:hypothetical protein